MIGMIYRNLYYHSNPSFLLVLYKALVQPRLEYCSLIWDPHQLYLQDHLRSVEKFALRVYLKTWRASYNELVTGANLTPLEIRWTRNKLLFVYKVLYKLSILPNDIFVPSTSRRSNRLTTPWLSHHVQYAPKKFTYRIPDRIRTRYGAIRIWS